MSDINIPGLTSGKYNSQEIVKGLVEAESTRLDSMEETLSEIESEQKQWQSINRKLSSLQSSMKSLYGFENPFNEKNVSSSNESILRATADRTADLSEYSLKVNQIATSDRFLSASLDKDYPVEGGLYSFQVGDDEINFRYRGGKLEDFAKKLNEQGNNLVRATVVRDTADTQVMLIEAVPTGSSNSLFFKDQAEELAISTQLIRRVPVQSDQVNFSRSNSVQSTGEAERVQLQNDTLLLRYKGKASIPMDSTFPIEDGTLLEMEVKVTELDLDQLIPQEPDPPELPEPPGISFQGISIHGAGSELELPPWENPPPPERIDDMQILSLNNGSSVIKMDALKASPEFVKVQIPLKEYLNNLHSLEFENNNTHRDIVIRNVQVYNPQQARGFEASNPVDTARDALLEFNGIEIRRETNDIDDLIPGVNLELQKAGDEEVDLKIEPDRELAKEGLIEFVFQYNQAVTEMLILSQDNTDIVDEIEYFTDEEREKAMEKLGSLRGDLTIMQIKNRLQSIVTAPYETSAGDAMALLAQLGISSNETGGGGYNASKLRGYLEVNEEELDQALNGDMTAIKELFGRDSDGDLIMDSGIGVRIDNYLKAFTQTGGILAMKDDRYDSQIDSQNEDIDEFKSYLEDYEADLKQEYGNMEGMLNQLESSTSSLENLMNSDN